MGGMGGGMDFADLFGGGGGGSGGIPGMGGMGGGMPGGMGGGMPFGSGGFGGMPGMNGHGGGAHGGGGGGARRPKKDAPHEMELECSLEDLFKGTTRRMKIRRGLHGRPVAVCWLACRTPWALCLCGP